ncbi:MAG: oligosaccharide flippase family protein [bacterium]
MSGTSYIYRGRYALLDRVVFALFTLTYTFLSARIIPREQYGILMISLSIAAFLNLASEAGVGSALVKHGSEEGADFGQVFFSALAVKLLFASIFSILVVSLSGSAARLLHNDGLSAPLRLLPLLIFATSLNNSIRQGMQARKNVKEMFLVDLAALCMLAVLYSSMTATARLDSASKVILLVSASSLLAGISGAVVWLTRVKPRPGISRETMLKLLNFGKYSTASELSTVLYSRIDTVMIGFFLTALAAATYSAAWVLSHGVNLLLSAISLLALPSASRAHSRGHKEDLKYIYESTTAIALTITIPLSVLLVIFSNQIIGLLYADRYPGAANVLRILAIWWLIKPFGNMAGNIFYGTGRPRVLAMLTSGSAVLNIVANLLLIPRYAVVGAACASVISLSLGTFTAYHLMQRWLEVSIRGIAGRMGSMFKPGRERFAS